MNISFSLIRVTLAIVFFTRCDSGSKKINKKELLGLYNVESVTPRSDSILLDPHMFDGSQRVFLILKEQDNFEFHVYKKTAVGYWTFETQNPSKRRLLLQSGYMPENVIYARFDKTHIYFDSPLWIFDSMYTRVIFKKVE